MYNSIVMFSKPGWVILPIVVRPATNVPSSFTLNHVPNSSGVLIARHTRAFGARSRSVFSIRSVLVAVAAFDMCNLLVAYTIIERAGNATFGLHFIFAGMAPDELPSRAKRGT